MPIDFLRKVFGGKGAVAAPPPAPLIEPRHVTDADFASVILHSDRPALVDFWAEWCGPCLALAPVIEDLATHYDGRAVIAKMDVDENSDWPQRFGILGIPTVIFFKDGQEVERVTGLESYDTLARKLDALLDQAG